MDYKYTLSRQRKGEDSFSQQRASRHSCSHTKCPPPFFSTISNARILWSGYYSEHLVEEEHRHTEVKFFAHDQRSAKKGTEVNPGRLGSKPIPQPLTENQVGTSVRSFSQGRPHKQESGL